jgi:hypothetical protein
MTSSIERICRIQPVDQLDNVKSSLAPFNLRDKGLRHPKFRSQRGLCQACISPHAFQLLYERGVLRGS